MAATDVTYLFFQRAEPGSADNGPLSPVIKTSRVVQHPIAGSAGRLRSGSMPPPSLRARAGSLPPGMRSGSVTPAARATSAVHHVAAAGGHGGIVKHRAMTTNVVHGVRSDGTTGVVAVPPRSSHAAASSAHRRRASISVVPGTAAAATAAAAAAARRKDNQQPIFRAEAFLRSMDSDKRTTDGIKPSLTSSLTRQMSWTSSSTSPAQPFSVRQRRSSVSVMSPRDSRQARTAVSRSLSSSLSLPASSPPRLHPPPPPPAGHLSAADAAAEIDIKSHVSRSDLPTPASVQAAFDKQLSKSSLMDLRNRADAARDRLSRHRTLIDRYLPLSMYLGPTGDVQDIVEYKVSELYDRMPQLDPNRSRDEHQHEDREVRASPITRIAPYQPLKPTNKVQLPPVNYTPTVVMPKISDVRKRARSVLCKVKGDPNYFNI